MPKIKKTPKREAAYRAHVTERMIEGVSPAPKKAFMRTQYGPITEFKGKPGEVKKKKLHHSANDGSFLEKRRRKFGAD